MWWVELSYRLCILRMSSTATDQMHFAVCALIFFLLTWRSNMAAMRRDMPQRIPLPVINCLKAKTRLPDEGVCIVCSFPTGEEETAFAVTSRGDKNPASSSRRILLQAETIKLQYNSVVTRTHLCWSWEWFGPKYFTFSGKKWQQRDNTFANEHRKATSATAETDILR